MASSLPPDLCPVHLCLEWTKAFGDCSAFCPAMQARDRHVATVKARITELSAQPFTEPNASQVGRLYELQQLRRELRVMPEDDD